ncbi:hypothetical protein A4A49_29512 [Nicotiana attenuata]|uniref:Uncharacterized protein n=1 Tax=Nicotiana attenuata TaxID=49451 RepID=A0A1J6IBF3_NICAT|nr:hypothetical protein A4A49_29512 [Nicotiana attenuata]
MVLERTFHSILPIQLPDNQGSMREDWVSPLRRLTPTPSQSQSFGWHNPLWNPPFFILRPKVVIYVALRYNS